MAGTAGVRRESIRKPSRTRGKRNSRPLIYRRLPRSYGSAPILPQLVIRLPHGKRRRLAKSMVRSFRRSARTRATKIVYRVAGLPIAVRALRHPPPDSPGKLVRSAYRSRYWTPASPGDLLELLLGVLLTPIIV